jgi:nitrogen fixation protein NifU and related proteins
VILVYTEKVMDNFTNPRNIGKMISADGEGVVGDVRCGDQLTFYIKVRNGIITDIKFLVFGCAASIATSSMTTEMAKGKTIKDAMNISEQDVIDALDGLPPVKYHCSNLGVNALRAAIRDYEEKKSLPRIKKIEIMTSKALASAREKVVSHMMERLHGG